MGRPTIVLHVSFCFAALVAQTCFSSSRAREVLYRPKRQVGCLSDDDFRCTMGECIKYFVVCDGTKDCDDGSDETKDACGQYKKRTGTLKIDINNLNNCIECASGDPVQDIFIFNIRNSTNGNPDRMFSNCSDMLFQCAYGACIDHKKLCDGKDDCADGSDETAPECPNVTIPFRIHQSSSCTYMEDEGFKCKSGQCISQYSACDAKIDCSDGSDETSEACLGITCPEYSVACSYGGCVAESARCNGHKDCIDNSDEDPSICPTKTPPVDQTSIIPPQLEACVLPKQPEFGSYTAPVCKTDRNLPACMNFNVPGTTLPHTWLLSFKCNDGYYIDGTKENPHLIVCLNGNWSEKIPVCKKKCSPLISLSVEVKCWYEGKKVNCSKHMLPTTKAGVHCNPFYEQIRPAPYREIECKENGEWDYPLIYCQPVCGKTNNDRCANNTSLINGESTEHIRLPWHAGLYLKNDSNLWEQKCGGSLISPHIVLTAAHCIFVEKDKKTVLSPIDVKVGLGKYYREWTRDEPYAIKSDVKQILKPDLYTGRASNYAMDIALLDLKYSVQINTNIMPVCIDWNPKYTIMPGTLGKLVGWGARINQTASEVLLCAELPYLEYRNCISLEESHYQQYITADKFCVHISNGVSAAEGDSGGGFTFVKDDLHFVYGIVSTKPNPHETQSSVLTFTNLMYTELINWLNDAKKIFDKEHPET